MTIKQYNFWRLAIVMLLAFSISLSISLQNYLLPLVAIAIGITVLQAMRRRVKAVLADECDYSLAGQSARYAISIFSIAMVIAMFALMYLGQSNQRLMDLSSVFAYLVCALMLINSTVFYFLRYRLKNEHKSFWQSVKAALPQIILVIIIAAMFAAGTLRLFSGEDTWICENGAWTQHGNPDSPMPSDTCK